MPIVHVVMFQFKADASPAAVSEICERMMSLKDKCVHPTTKQKYIKSARGGRDNSPEGNQGGITHVFVEEFENDEDRKYYLEQDPEHVAFVKSVGPLLEKAQVVDFTPGVF